MAASPQSLIRNIHHHHRPRDGMNFGLRKGCRRTETEIETEIKIRDGSHGLPEKGKDGTLGITMGGGSIIIGWEKVSVAPEKYLEVPYLQVPNWWLMSG